MTAKEKKKSIYTITYYLVIDITNAINEHKNPKKPKYSRGDIYDKAILGNDLKELMLNNNVPSEKIESIYRNHEYLKI